ncbi:hypothetical protein D3C86_1990920 [compost metagenome]
MRKAWPMAWPASCSAGRWPAAELPSGMRASHSSNGTQTSRIKVGTASMALRQSSLTMIWVSSTGKMTAPMEAPESRMPKARPCRFGAIQRVARVMAGT